MTGDVTHHYRCFYGNVSSAKTNEKLIFFFFMYLALYRCQRNIRLNLAGLILVLFFVIFESCDFFLIFFLMAMSMKSLITNSPFFFFSLCLEKIEVNNCSSLSIFIEKFYYLCILNEFCLSFKIYRTDIRIKNREREIIVKKILKPLL